MTSSAVGTDASRDRTRGRDEADDDQDGVPEHLKCVVCLGEGRDRANPTKSVKRSREPPENVRSCGGSGRVHTFPVGVLLEERCSEVSASPRAHLATA